MKNGTNKSRTLMGSLSGGVGIGLNILLFVIKFILGTVSHSMAIVADAFNNLSDMGTSVINLIAFRVSGKPADEDHPFGHGRAEYISSLVVAFLVLFLGLEVAVSSVKRIIEPEELVSSSIVLILLIVSIVCKALFGMFNVVINKRLNSVAVSAVAKDSFSDAAVTFCTVISLLLVRFFGINIDGYIGLLVSVFVLWQGVGILRKSVSLFLGRPADKQLSKSVKEAILCADERIIDIHDLMLHDYGPENCYGSVHIALPSDMSFKDVHNVADNIENLVLSEYAIHIVVHPDPIEASDSEQMNFIFWLKDFVKGIDEHYLAHEIKYYAHNDTLKIVEFDLSIDEDHKQSVAELENALTRAVVDKLGEGTKVKINFEYSYTLE